MWHVPSTFLHISAEDFAKNIWLFEVKKFVQNIMVEGNYGVGVRNAWAFSIVHINFCLNIAIEPAACQEYQCNKGRKKNFNSRNFFTQ